MKGNDMSNHYLKGSLLATTVIAGMAFATPGFAQTVQENQPTTATTPGTAAAGSVDSPASSANVQPTVTTTGAPPTGATGTSPKADPSDIVVTGSILRRATSPSPITRLTAETLDRRGVSTVQDAIQTLASNNGPALTNSFTANGAFASGASAVSLRGLSTNSTLVLFDGLRAAYYPLADDGSRNFVDLNTIPDDIVERIDVLRDGASASYGADAIAGVVNIITKKEFKASPLASKAANPAAAMPASTASTRRSASATSPTRASTLTSAAFITRARRSITATVRIRSTPTICVRFATPRPALAVRTIVRMALTLMARTAVLTPRPTSSFVPIMRRTRRQRPAAAMSTFRPASAISTR